MSSGGRPYVGPVREVRVDAETWAEVERLARLGGVSASRWVRDAITYRLVSYQSQSSDRMNIDHR